MPLMLVGLLEKQIMIINKTTDIEGKTLATTGLATTATLNAVKNETPNVSDIVKKTDYDAEIPDTDVKYFTMSDYNKFTNDILDTKIKQNTSKFIKNIGLDEKIKNQQYKHVTQVFLLVNCFFNDGSQNFLTFQPGPTETIVAWQSKGLSNENIDLLIQQNIIFLQN